MRFIYTDGRVEHRNMRLLGFREEIEINGRKFAREEIKRENVDPSLVGWYQYREIEFTDRTMGDR